MDQRLKAVKYISVLCIVLCVSCQFVTSAYAEEEIGLVQRLWRKITGKSATPVQETVQPSQEAVQQPVQAPIGEKPSGNITDAAKTDVTDGKNITIDEDNRDKTILSDDELKGLTKEEAEELEQLKEDTIAEMEERERIKNIRDSDEARKKPGQLPISPR